MDDLESLKRAFAGAHGAYCVTFYWAHFSPEKENAEAASMARAAKEAGVQHAIWSTLEDTRRWVPLGDNRMPTLMGKYKVPHFDAKGESDHLFADAGVPTTYLLTVLLLGQLHLLRHGTETRAGWQAWPSRCRWATGSCRASPRKTSASAPTAFSARATSISERPSASRAGILTGAEMAAGIHQGARPRSPLQRRAA